MGATNKIPKIISLSFVLTNVLNIVMKSNDLESTGYYDTLTQDDIVRTQYCSLPYPAVSNEEFVRERNHYESKHQNVSYNIYPTVTINNLKKVLFKQKDVIRYSSNTP